MSLTFDEAKAKCESLSTNSGIVSRGDFVGSFVVAFSAWKTSVIGKKLLSMPTEPEIWTDDAQVFPFTRNIQNSRAPAGDRALAVCWKQ